MNDHTVVLRGPRGSVTYNDLSEDEARMLMAKFLDIGASRVTKSDDTVTAQYFAEPWNKR